MGKSSFVADRQVNRLEKVLHDLRSVLYGLQLYLSLYL